MCKQFHSGNILNKKFHPGMVRDLKTDCAKRTEEVRSGFCNIGSGVSLKRQKRHQKAKNCFLVSFLCSGWKKEGRQEQPLIGYIYIMDWNVEKWRTQIPFTRIVLYGKEPGREIFQRSGRKNYKGL